MKATKTVTVRLDIDDYERLVSEAGRFAMSPARLAQSYVRAGLAGSIERTDAVRGRIGQAALEGLAVLRKRLPYADAVEVVAFVWEWRNALEQRMALQPEFFIQFVGCARRCPRHDDLWSLTTESDNPRSV